MDKLDSCSPAWKTVYDTLTHKVKTNIAAESAEKEKQQNPSRRDSSAPLAGSSSRPITSRSSINSRISSVYRPKLEPQRPLQQRGVGGANVVPCQQQTFQQTPFVQQGTVQQLSQSGVIEHRTSDGPSKMPPRCAEPPCAPLVRPLPTCVNSLPHQSSRQAGNQPFAPYLAPVPKSARYKLQWHSWISLHKQKHLKTWYL